MVTENLNIKMTLDTSDVDRGVKKVESSLTGLGKAGSKGSAATTQSMKELHDSMEQIRNLQFADMILENIDSLKVNFGAVKDYAKQAAYEFSNIFSANYWKGYEAESIGDIAYAVKNQLGEAADSAKKGFKALGSAGAAAFRAVHGWLLLTIAGVVALVANIRNAIRTAQELTQTFYEARKIGLSTTEYEEWGYILSKVGSDVQDLSDFLKTLADEQNAVREGSEDIIKAFAAIGLSANEVASMGQGELFRRTIEGLQKIESVVERTAISYKIFGEDAAQLTNLISMSNEEMSTMLNNFYLLGGASSSNLIKKSQTLSGAISNLKIAWQGLTNTLAEFFMPVITAVINWLTMAIAKFNMFVRAMLGYEIVSRGDGVEQAATNMSSYGSAVESATAAVEKLKRVTMGFDELNIVGNPNSSAGSGAGGSYSGGGSMGGALAGLPTAKDLNLDEFAAKMEKYKEIIRNVVPIALVVIGVLGAVYMLLHGNILGAIPFIGLAGLGIGIGIENGLWAEYIENFKKVILPLLPQIMTGIGILGAIACLLMGNFPGAIAFGVMGGIGIYQLGVEGGWWSTLAENIKIWWNNLTLWYKTNVAPIFTKSWWVDKFNSIKDAAADRLDAVKSTVGDKWNGMKSWFVTEIKPKFTLAYWKGHWDNVVKGAREKLNEVRTTLSLGWAPIANWFNTTIKPKLTLNYWKSVLQAIPSAVKDIFNGVIGFVERALNAMIDKANQFHISIPWWVPGVGGNSFGINLARVYIPRLATGGIATRSTLANIGENGKEAVLPLENNTEWMDVLANRIAARQSQTVILKVGETELGRATIKAINGITTQTGGLQLII